MATAVQAPSARSMGGKMPRHYGLASASAAATTPVVAKKSSGGGKKPATTANGDASEEKKVTRTMTDREAINQPLNRRKRNYIKLGVFFGMVDDNVDKSPRWQTLIAGFADPVVMSWTKDAKLDITDLIFGLASDIVNTAVYYAHHAGRVTLAALSIESAVKDLISDETLRDNILIDIQNIKAQYAALQKQAKEHPEAAKENAAAGGDENDAKKNNRKSAQYGLILPLARFHHVLKSVCGGSLQISEIATILLTAIMESLLKELIHDCRVATLNSKRRQVAPEHVKKALYEEDVPLGNLFLNRSAIRMENDVIFLRTNVSSVFTADLDPEKRKRKTPAVPANPEDPDNQEPLAQEDELEQEMAQQEAAADEEEEPVVAKKASKRGGGKKAKAAAPVAEEEEEAPAVAKKAPRKRKTKTSADGDEDTPAPAPKVSKKRASGVIISPAEEDDGVE